MFSRLSRSLAFRSGGMYRHLLRALPAAPVALPAYAGTQVVTMTDRKHVLMCEQMLASLGRTWKALPSVRLLLNGHVPGRARDRLRRCLARPIEFHSWEEVAAHHRGRGRPELTEFATANLLGRKLAFIVFALDRERTLWVDNDILFFRDFLPLLERQPRGVFVGATRDMAFGRTDPYCSYAPELARYVFRDTPDVPLVNTGLCLAEGPVYEAFRLAEAVQRTLATAEKSYFTEQTVLAWAALQSRGIVWEEPIVHLDDADIFTHRPTFLAQAWHARHYTGNIRHLFWRDAFHLRYLR